MSRAALYIDFDNVFSGLLTADPTAALVFAERPHEWLARLGDRYLADETARRWLVRRCYINPAGSVADPRGTSSTQRLYFSRFRPFFVRAGFEVIDCPALSHRAKNAADVRMALDAMEALTAPAHYDEFVIASGDSDLTPLLVRLRAADRRVTVMSASDAAQAYLSIADRLIGVDETASLLRDEPPESPGDDLPPADGLPPAETYSPEQVASAFESFSQGLQTENDAATEALNLATLAHEAREKLGPVVTASRWFGHGSFSGALDAVGLDGAQRSQHLLWDRNRHEPPVVAPSAKTQVPPPVERLCVLLDVPRLTSDNWRRVYGALALYAREQEGEVVPGEASRWARDRLEADGEPVGRAAVSFVERGCRFVGVTLDATPPPTSEDLADAFVRNTLDRAQHAGIELSDEELDVVRRWMGGEG